MTDYQHIDHGFEPVYDESSRVLVLGSFPSVLSRANDFYYGNPQNRFWRVMSSCLGEPTPTSIAEKREMLLAHGIASCDIRGSSDASIKNVVPVDVARVTSAAPIEAVLCNGATSGRLYHRYLEAIAAHAAVVMPSTSPANAAWSLDRLTERWAEELAALGVR